MAITKQIAEQLDKLTVGELKAFLDIIDSRADRCKMFEILTRLAPNSIEKIKDIMLLYKESRK